MTLHSIADKVVNTPLPEGEDIALVIVFGCVVVFVFSILSCIGR